MTHASATASKIQRRRHRRCPTTTACTSRSDWELSGQAYIQPNDYLLASAGAIAYSGRTQATGSMLSLGFSWAQLDVGYRDHWLSPMTDSSTLLSTEAPTMPSVTLSNYEPITRLGFQYEFFLARGCPASDAYFVRWGREQRQSASVRRAAVHRTLPGLVARRQSPATIRRRLRHADFGTFSADAISSSQAALNQSQGNQQASYVSRFIFPGKTPFAVYAQYAGEDNSDGGSYLLGNAALSVGIDFPASGPYFDATYEISEWQNIWYVHNIYLDGMTNDGLVLGNWGADQRNFGDGVGARSQMLRVGWVPDFGGYLRGAGAHAGQPDLFRR